MDKIRVLIAVVLLLCLKVSACAGATKKVYPGSNAIQKAIASSHRGDTIDIQGGVYKEHDIVIKQQLVIIGTGYPVIDAEDKYQGLLINADSVVIQGLRIQNTGRASTMDIAGVKVLNSGYVTIRKNQLYDDTYGVYMQNAHHCIVSDNIIRSNAKSEINNGNGIHAWKSMNLFINGNTCTGQRDGIYFEFVTDSRIENNSSFGNMRYGLHFMFSHDDTYSNNTFKDNGAGVAVMYSHGVSMYNNIFTHNWGDASYGLLLKEISNSIIEHNQFTKNTVGIHMEGTTHVDVKHCTFTDNGWALHVQASCSGSNFTENNFLGNSFDVATNGTLVLNVFNNNYWDKYDGYDLNKDRIGDVPYYPVSVYSVITEKIPTAMILYRSFLTDVMDQVEKVMPSIIPDQLKDDHPMMKRLNL